MYAWLNPRSGLANPWWKKQTQRTQTRTQTTEGTTKIYLHSHRKHYWHSFKNPISNPMGYALGANCVPVHMYTPSEIEIIFFGIFLDLIIFDTRFVKSQNRKLEDEFFIHQLPLSLFLLR